MYIWSKIGYIERGTDEIVNILGIMGAKFLTVEGRSCRYGKREN
jgi:hypothetical protein